MSASLVGSEMCIRDRHSTAGVQASRPPISLRGATAVQRSVARQYHRVTAVSYTHLTLPTICSV
eukprot:4085126-Alexandrium_andersonii.AAC.1